MSAPAASEAPCRLLVVDDEDGVRLILQRLLARMPRPPPVEVRTAPSAEAALEALEREHFDLILSDFNMGGKDGIFLLAATRERWPDTIRCLMTGYTDEEIRRRAQEEGGVAAFIRKPWDNQAVLALLRALLLEQRGGAAAPANEG